MLEPILSPALVAAFIALMLGLIVGSFANVVVHRLPLDQSIVLPASRCPKCGAAIKPWNNLPVLSWLLLRGRCASCREPIAIRYPLVEALHGIGFALIVLRFGPFPFTLLLMAFFSALVILALIDWDHQILPDAITLPGVLAGLAGSFLTGALVDWREAGLAAGFGYFAFFAVAEGYARVRGIEGLGEGDWKLAAMLGAFLGPQRLMLVIFLASVSGMVYGLVQALRLRKDQAPPPIAVAPSSETSETVTSRMSSEDRPVEEAQGIPGEVEGEPAPVSIGKYKLPFGTFLAGAAIVVLFEGDLILAWYASLFGF